MIRNPVVAGQFYPGTEKPLLKMVESMLDETLAKENAIGVVSPHAGYQYSGLVAGNVLSSIKTKPVYIIMGPNHTGLGAPFSISGADSWKTPLGNVAIDKILAAEIKKNCRFIKEEDMAHAGEHSIEVQLPFLQALQKGFKFVPIVIAQADIEVYKEIGRAIAESIKRLKMENDVTIIASSDMTHYEPHEEAKKKDDIAIKAMLALDEERLVSEINRLDITMCGYAPATIMLSAAKALGAKKARLVKYLTSGDASGDYSSVVGYAGLIIT
jgi:MEMO1 family protein